MNSTEPAGTAGRTSPTHPGDLGLLIAGNTVSALGNSVYLIAVTLLLKEMTGSAFMLGLFQFLALSPGFLLSPFIGVLVDRLPRRTIIIVSDFCRAVLMILAGIALTIPALHVPGVVLIVAFFAGVGHAVFVPAVHALLPAIVPHDKLQSATGLRAGSSQLANLAGNAIGGTLFVFLGGPILFVINGISFFISGIQELFIQGGRQPVPQTTHQSMIAMAQVGLRAVAQDRTLQTLLISQAGLFLVSPFLILALPFLLIDELGMSESALGLYLALALAGGIVGFLVLRKVTHPFLLTNSLHGYSYLALGAAFAAVGLAPHPVVLGVAAVVSGVAAATVYLVTVTWIQVRSRPQLHGRLFAVLEAGNSAFAPVGYLVAGILLELLGANHRMALLVAVASAALAWGVAMLWYNRITVQDQDR